MTHREFQRLADEAKGRLEERGYGSRIYIKNMPGLDLSLDEYRPVYTVFILIPMGLCPETARFFRMGR